MKRCADARARSLKASPTLADVRSELGSKATYETHADGSWTATVRDDSASIGRAASMLDGVRAVDADFGAEVQAGIARERVRRDDGRVVEVAQMAVEHIKGGIRPVIRWGRPSMRLRGLPDGGSEESVQQPDGSWVTRRWTREELAARPPRPVW